MRIWTVANQKGGVGKTTVVTSLAGLLAQRGRSVLMVDLDPHGSLSSYFGFDPDSVEPNLYGLFQNPSRTADPQIAHPTGVDGLYLMPASTALATLDRQFGNRKGMGLVIKRAVTSMADRFEHTILDCPPMLGVLMVNALAACHRLVIPVQTEFLALKGLERMVGTIDMINRSRSNQLPYTIVPTLYDRRTRAANRALEEVRQRYTDKVWGGAIPIDTQFREASRDGLPLTVSLPWSRGSIAIRKLLEHLLVQDKLKGKEVAKHG
ncbi:chromosome (plasmid) partitioning protein ParA [Halorhodospira halochloris]|uniref:Chromosome (Plasmid) partitioning protein ParA n=1 Tax=Halorhodospira halochloris TaxID=1052 RepID=A0A110B5U0_HALHR|nr:ParA family protein [Halorhodospira halochloris]MBK1651838.1 cobalamin biosynthesis protein CobQ [Halorhodospira halochloris]BAU58827.1 chromosome (plasmid) partitioning protein ParA [Halorhodospira halochloris]